jgi:hypothetical protein
MKAIHNKDYSVVKTFSASPICGAFVFYYLCWVKKEQKPLAGMSPLFPEEGKRLSLSVGKLCVQAEERDGRDDVCGET